MLSQLGLFAEYSAAAYCSNNINSTGDALSCEEDNCPSVQSADTTTLWEFDRYEFKRFQEIFPLILFIRACSYGNVAGFLAVDKTNKLLVVSFRGSRSISTWIANINFSLTNASSLCKGCEAHSGFLESWETVADDLVAQIESAQSIYSGYLLVLTGHSFGAAVAVLGGTALRNRGSTLSLVSISLIFIDLIPINKPQYTYGQPRVGNTALATYITNQGSLWRVTHQEDIVAKLPPSGFRFRHPSPEYWVTSENNATVTSSDVKIIQGVGSRLGNAGTLKPDVEAHHWYFGYIDECK